MGIGYTLLPIDSILLVICAFNLGGLPFSIGYIYKNLFIKVLVLYTVPF